MSKVIKLGSITPLDIALGDTSIAKAFLGVNQVWPACDLPPYGCRTDVRTLCVEDFSQAWQNCTDIVEFPSNIDVGNGLYFYQTWQDCTSLTSFPAISTSSAQFFNQTWMGCSSLTSFPFIETSSANESGFQGYFSLYYGERYGTWCNCTSLVNFPANMFDNCACIYFEYAWYNCALSQQSVDNILVSLDAAGQSNGFVNLDGGSSSAPGTAGAAAKASLEAKGWTVVTN